MFSIVANGVGVSSLFSQSTLWFAKEISVPPALFKSINKKEKRKQYAVHGEDASESLT